MENSDGLLSWINQLEVQNYKKVCQKGQAMIWQVLEGFAQYLLIHGSTLL